jgi:RNA ligase (TIGR02306 family)
MSTFAVLVRRLDAVTPHPDAQRLDVAQVGGYQTVVGKGQFQAGDFIAYVPEGAVLSPDLIAALGLTGKLAGTEHNRVHAIRLRGVLSQGLCLEIRSHWQEGQDVADELGVTKYVPEIPKELLGAVYPLEREEILQFELEDIKAFPDVFQEGEPVVFTEKIHGVFMMAAGIPARMARDEPGAALAGRFIVSSKGLMHRQLGFQWTDANQASNLYVQAALAHDLTQWLPALAERHDAPVFLLGELAGSGVQDLLYGQTNGGKIFRGFAMVVGKRVLDDAELDAALAEMGLLRAPVLYRGPFSQAVLTQYTSGRESVSGQEAHLREGVVVTPQHERHDPRIGRVMLRSLSPEYLLRTGGTEYS